MIIGDTVRLRGIEKEDLPLFVNWLNDPDVRRYLSL
jgi:RimJ/RimL family protein N-acetyltransferase